MNPLLESIEIETGANPQHAVIWLHGLGADGHDFAPIVPELGLQDAPAIRFIFPHAPIQPVTINGGMAMRSWYDIYVADLVRHEDESGLRQSQIEVQNLIARENARGIPTENIVLAGFSQGCAMTLQTGLRLPERLAGMLCLSGYLPLAAAVAKERHPANQDTPIFMAHGSMDPVVPLTRAEASRQQLEAMGYQVQWNVYPMPHAVCPEEITAIGQFFKQVLR
ncbi:alpha/beta hydrolase [Providencia rettgeri]|uniref:alpha/beta hydrolase n=1 Tax=Alcaligenes sp. SORT26 TaxID=2813780 RepID=UPI001A9CF22C|nr:alpha/beta hydrolase [Alcaligenes sp. SORT26]MBY6347111.1 alpha/beta hydrolase [Providencia rettgeri]QTB98402.1 alpha/beta hydrolase [Alcaligenes sp. SORT26]